MEASRRKEQAEEQYVLKLKAERETYDKRSVCSGVIESLARLRLPNNSAAVVRSALFYVRLQKLTLVLTSRPTAGVKLLTTAAHLQ